VEGEPVRVLVSVLLLMFLAGCAGTPARSAAQRAADADLTERVAAALGADPSLFARHIDVSADDGVVYLEGYVWSPEDLYTARHLAAAVPGVTAVNSQLELLRGGSKGR
jgi:hyperosmotically inducible protein